MNKGDGMDEETKGAVVTGLAALFYAALVHSQSTRTESMQAQQGACFDAAESLVAMAAKRGHLKLVKGKA